MKKTLLVLLTITLVVFMSGCPMFGGSSPGGGSNDIPNNDGGGSNGGSVNNKVQLTNYSNYVLTELYISPSSYSDWGYNQLNDYVYSGEYIIISGIPDDCYDLRVVNEIGYYADIYEVCLYDNMTFYWDIYDAKKALVTKSAAGEMETTAVVEISDEDVEGDSLYLPANIEDQSKPK
jgi:hypothetical protein